MTDIIERLRREIVRTVSIDIMHEEAAAEITRLRAENAELKQWQQEMVNKAADKSPAGYRELGSKCAALENENAELRRDAERYHWLRNRNVLTRAFGRYFWSDELDYAIDAAMAQEHKT